MLEPEWISLYIALLAVIISTISLIRTGKLGREQLKLQRISAKLTERELELIERSEIEKDLPKISVEMLKYDTSYKFLVKNIGSGTAFNLRFDIIETKGACLLLPTLNSKFPHQELKSGETIRLNAIADAGIPIKYLVQLSWKNSKGVECSETYHVTPK